MLKCVLRFRYFVRIVQELELLGRVSYFFRFDGSVRGVGVGCFGEGSCIVSLLCRSVRDF